MTSYIKSGFLFRVRFVHYLLYFIILRITPIVSRVVLAGKQNRFNSLFLDDSSYGKENI